MDIYSLLYMFIPRTRYYSEYCWIVVVATGAIALDINSKDFTKRSDSRADNVPVSYTHLTLPTNREV